MIYDISQSILKFIDKFVSFNKYLFLLTLRKKNITV